jgi:uncharacterized membrane protein (DUF485 family)
MSTTELKRVEKIRNQYTEREKTKFDELKALDRKVKRPASIFAYVFGVIGALVLGTGMSLAMKIIGDLMALGIVIGLVGIAMVSLAYPIYKSILQSRKNKYSSKILELTNELLHD